METKPFGNAHHCKGVTLLSALGTGRGCGSNPLGHNKLTPKGFMYYILEFLRNKRIPKEARNGNFIIIG
jgi:hypothetical protein